MRVPKTISAHWLRKHGACESGVTRFISLFGKKPIPITWEAILKARKFGLEAHFFMDYYNLCEDLDTCVSRDTFRKVFGR